MQLILASQSPRRRELLEEAGYTFTVVPPSAAAESGGAHSGESAAEMVARLAERKARDVAERIREGTVIGCDTVAECQGQILGKPADQEHARQMLLWLRGRKHRVVSGLCLIRRPENDVQVRVAETALEMLPLGAAEIEAYLASGAWQGKAGAFGLQDRLGWIRILGGSESNVVGLPLELLRQMLER